MWIIDQKKCNVTNSDSVINIYMDNASGAIKITKTNGASAALGYYSDKRELKQIFNHLTSTLALGKEKLYTMP